MGTATLDTLGATHAASTRKLYALFSPPRNHVYLGRKVCFVGQSDHVNLRADRDWSGFGPCKRRFRIQVAGAVNQLQRNAGLVASSEANGCPLAFDSQGPLEMVSKANRNVAGAVA